MAEGDPQKRWYDVTLPLTPEMPVWPGDPPVRVEPLVEGDDENPFSILRLEMSTHTGTHVDAPRHLFPEGSGVDVLPLHELIGPAYVVDARGVKALSPAVLTELDIPAKATRLLFRTDNEMLWRRDPHRFHTDFVALTPEGAQWLVGRGIRLVGIDYLSIAQYGMEVPVHHHLLSAHVIIVEGLRLEHVPPGWYEMFCLPLKVHQGDGAPARVVLRKL